MCGAVPWGPQPRPRGCRSVCLPVCRFCCSLPPIPHSISQEVAVRQISTISSAGALRCLNKRRFCFAALLSYQFRRLLGAILGHARYLPAPKCEIPPSSHKQTPGPTSNATAAVRTVRCFVQRWGWVAAATWAGSEGGGIFKASGEAGGRELVALRGSPWRVVYSPLSLDLQGVGEGGCWLGPKTAQGAWCWMARWQVGWWWV